MSKVTIEGLVGEVHTNPDPHDIIEMIIEPIEEEFVDPYEGNDEDFSPHTRDKRIHLRLKWKTQKEKYHQESIEFNKSTEGKKAFDYIIEMKLNTVNDGMYSKIYWSDQRKAMPDHIKSYRKRFKKKVKDDYDKLKPENVYDHLNGIWYFYILTDKEREKLVEKERKEKEFWKEKYETLYESKKWSVLDEVRNTVTKQYYQKYKGQFHKYEFYRSQFNKYKNMLIEKQEGHLKQIEHNRVYGYGNSRSQDDIQQELDKKMESAKRKKAKEMKKKKKEKKAKMAMMSSSDEEDSD